MENLIGILMILAFAGFIILLIAGATNKVVIYYDIKDFLISLAPGLSILIAVLIADNPEMHDIKQIILIAGILIAAGFLIWSVKLSIFYNRNTALGIIVGLFKVISALIGVVVVVSHIFRIMDRKSSLRDVIWAMLIISIFTWIGKKLINGEQVYIEKGWTLPESATTTVR